MAQLSTYLKMLRNTYTEARREYTRLQDLLISEKKEWEAADRNRHLNNSGKRAAWERMDQNTGNIRKELRALIDNTNQKFAEIRDWVEKDFHSVYGMVPEKIDSNGMELLRSGLLTEKELAHLVERYSNENNGTMIRMVGKAIDDRLQNDAHNPALHELAGRIKAIGTPHLEAVDAYTFVCTQGLREDRVVSDAIDRRMQESTWNRVNEQYGNIRND